MKYISDKLFSAWPILDGVSLHVAMNDSATWLLEWVLYHRMLGFGRISVHGDGANRESQRLCSELEAAGLIRYYPTSTPGLSAARGRVEASMKEALAADLKDKVDFSLWLEPEEFLLVSTGEGRLTDLWEKLMLKSPTSSA